MNLPVDIRERKESDNDFLYATWIKSFADSAFARPIPKPIYNLSQRSRIEKILDKPETYCLVASDKESPELIYGWLVGEAPNIVHYIYVKRDYRQQGICKKLLEHLDTSEPILYTHKVSTPWLEQKWKEDRQLTLWLYDPYWVEREQ